MDRESQSNKLRDFLPLQGYRNNSLSCIAAQGVEVCTGAVVEASAPMVFQAESTQLVAEVGTLVSVCRTVVSFISVVRIVPVPLKVPCSEEYYCVPKSSSYRYTLG